MLTSLSLTNFKSWERIEEMRLAPITGLFGTNSSGKTSILQLLLLLKQTVESSDRAQVLNLGDRHSRVALGTLADVVHRGVSPRQLSWKVTWDLPDTLLAQDWANNGVVAFEDDLLSFEALVTEGINRQRVVDRFAYSFAGHLFGMEWKKPALNEYRLFTRPDTFGFRHVPGKPKLLPKPVKCYGFPDQVKAYYLNTGFLADFELALEERFARVYYLGPIRVHPEREYTWGGGETTDVGQRGEDAVAALLAARGRDVKISRGKGRRRQSLEQYVARWLRELKLVHGFAVEPIVEGGDLYRVSVQQAPSAPEVLLTDVGFGVSQILPVLVLCYYVPEGSTIILEQPDIHLHPSVQAGMADVLIDAVKVRKVQILVESHSEHLLLRLQRRIAEEKLSKEDTALYFCNLEDGKSRLTELDLDEYGNIRNWPKDFFGDAFQEATARLEGEIKRKSREAA